MEKTIENLKKMNVEQFTEEFININFQDIESLEVQEELNEILQKKFEIVQDRLQEACILYDHYLENDLEYLETFKEVKTEYEKWDKLYNELYKINVFRNS